MFIPAKGLITLATKSTLIGVKFHATDFTKPRFHIIPLYIHPARQPNSPPAVLARKVIQHPPVKIAVELVAAKLAHCGYKGSR